MHVNFSSVKKYLITMLLFFALIVISSYIINLDILIPETFAYVYILVTVYIILNLILAFFFLNSYFWRDLDWRIPKETKDSKLSNFLNYPIINKNIQTFT